MGQRVYMKSCMMKWSHGRGGAIYCRDEYSDLHCLSWMSARGYHTGHAGGSLP